MSYTNRGLKLGEEATFGSSIACSISFNNLFTWEGRINENVMEEAIVTGARDAVARAALEREVTARINGELLNARLFYYAMGSIAPSTTVTPYTIFPAATIPSLTLQRILGPTANCTYLYGAKIDSMVLTMEVGQDVTYEINFTCSDATVTTDSITVPSLVTISPFMYYHGKLTAAGSTVTELQSCVIEINNNLYPRFSCDSSRTNARSAYALKEGRFQVTGRFTTGGFLETLSTYVQSQTQFTLELTLAKAGLGTIVLTMPNVQLSELPDALSGREPYEIEFPFIASPQSGFDALKVAFTGNSFSGHTIV